MKKVIVGLAIVATAIAANASSFKWSSTGTIYQPGTTTAMSSITAYLFDVDTVSQGALVTALRGGGAITDYSAMSTYAADAAKVSATTFTYGTTGNDYNAYFAIVTSVGGNDYVYISNEKTAAATEADTTSFLFASQSTSSGNVFGATTAYSSAGWYAVPFRRTCASEQAPPCREGAEVRLSALERQ